MLRVFVSFFLFRCEVAEAVERIFVSFAKAFKKPQDSPDRRPSAQSEVGKPFPGLAEGLILYNLS